MEEQQRPLGQVEDVGELMERYAAFDNATLRRWMEVVTGPHREAMERILEQRKKNGTP